MSAGVHQWGFFFFFLNYKSNPPQPSWQVNQLIRAKLLAEQQVCGQGWGTSCLYSGGS